MTFQEGLGLTIHELRTGRFETASAFAKNCNISPKTLNNIEKGLTDPFLSTIQKIADYLGLSAKELLCMAESKEQNSKYMLKENKTI